MDLFSLVARLTLDVKDYEKALKDAERKGSKVKVDATGKISLRDDYSAAIDQAKAKASNADIKATGDITANDKYTPALGEAESAGQEFAPDANDEITATDEYSGEIADATTAGKDFDPNASDTIEAVDEYTGALSSAETAANNFDATAQGTITADDQLPQALSDAATEAGDFEATATGDIVGNDELTGTLETLEDSVDDYDLDAQGEATFDHDSFDTEVGNTVTVAEGFESKMTDIMGRVSSALTAAGIVAGIKRISAAIAGAVRDSAQYADTVDKGKDALHISAKAYQEWDHALSQSGASIDDVQKGLWALFDLWKEGDPSEEALKLAGALEDIKAFTGIDLDKSNFSSLEEQFAAIMKALAEMDDTAERQSIIDTIFGEKKGAVLNSLLKDGSKGIEQLIAEAHELGLIMSDEDIASGVQYGDAVANMNAAVDALKRNVSAGLFPLLEKAAKMITDIVNFFNGTDTSAGGMFADINKEMGKSIATADKDEQVTYSLISALRAMSDETGTCKGNLEAWQKTARELISLCPSLAKQINTVTGKINEESGSLEQNAQKWFENMRAQILADALEKKRQVVSTKMGDVIDKQLNLEIARGEADYVRQRLAKDFAEQYNKANPDATEDSWWQSLGFKSMEDFNSADRERMANARQALFDMTGKWVDFSGSELLDGVVKAQRELSKAQEEYLKAQQLYEESVTAGQKLLESWGVTENAGEGAGEGAAEGAAEGVKEGAEEGEEAVKGLKEAVDGLEDKTVTVTVETEGAFPGSLAWDEFQGMFPKPPGYAKGQPYVPYDGLALLHRGERVLTASQARRDNDGGSDAIVDAIRALRGDITNLQIVVGQKAFGRTVVQYGGKRMNGFLSSEEDRLAAGYGWG